MLLPYYLNETALGLNGGGDTVNRIGEPAIVDVHKLVIRIGLSRRQRDRAGSCCRHTECHHCCHVSVVLPSNEQHSRDSQGVGAIFF